MTRFFLYLSLSLVVGTPVFAADAPFDDSQLIQSMGLTERYISVDNFQFHMVEKGEGQPIIFLHGFPEFWFSWRHVLKNFPAGYRLIAIDMPGFNKSDKPSDTDFYLATNLAKYLHRLVETLNLGPVYVVSQDWGGFVAWRMAYMYPKDIIKLVVMNNPNPEAWSDLKHATILDMLNQLKSTIYIPLFNTPWIAEKILGAHNYNILRNNFRLTQGFSEDEIDIFINALDRPQALTSGLNYYRANARLLRIMGLSSTGNSELDGLSLTTPTLLLWGTKDNVMTPVMAELSRSHLPQGSDVKLLNCGHFPQSDLPETVTREIISFFQNTMDPTTP